MVRQAKCFPVDDQKNPVRTTSAARLGGPSISEAPGDFGNHVDWTSFRNRPTKSHKKLRKPAK